MLLALFMLKWVILSRVWQQKCLFPIAILNRGIKAKWLLFWARSKYAKDTIFVGDKNDTIAAQKALLTQKTQWTDYMEEVLSLTTINSDTSVGPNQIRRVEEETSSMLCPTPPYNHHPQWCRLRWITVGHGPSWIFWYFLWWRIRLLTDIHPSRLRRIRLGRRFSYWRVHMDRRRRQHWDGSLVRGSWAMV